MRFKTKFLINNIVFIVCFQVCSSPLFYNSSIVSNLQKSISDSLIKMQLPGEVKVEPVNSRWIIISNVPKWNSKKNKFSTAVIDPVDAEKTDNYILVETLSKKNISVVKSGFKRRVLYAPNPSRKNDLRMLENIFLEIPENLKENIQYTLTINPNVTGKKISEKFIFSPETSLSRILHIDPYGFRSEDVKKIYFGLNMGSAGELIPDPYYQLINLETNSVYHFGKIEKQIYSGWPSFLGNKPYDKVYSADFSHVTIPGEYIIKHSSGYSLPFVIFDDIYRITLNTLALGMYNQRRGEDILSEYTRFARKGTIENNAYIYDSKHLDKFVTKLLNKMPEGKKNIKYKTNLEGKHVKFESAGHMDAGDYSPYTYNSSLMIYNIITTLDLFKDKVFHDNLGLPESGDGIPDLLQEVIIEINWLKSMQDTEDGGVFSMSKPLGCSYQNTMPGEKKNLKRYLAPKDTTATGAYTAALARVARSDVIKKHYPKLVEEMKSRAIKSWEWLEKNPGYHGFHHYGKENADLDERAWAAIELYALTGNQKYHTAFEQLHKPMERANGVEWMNHSYGNVNRTLALWDINKIEFRVNPELKIKSVQRFYDYLEFCVKNAENMPYGLSFNDVYKRFYTVGWFFPVSSYSWDLLIGYKLYSNKKFLEIALGQIHYTLGANPLNKTFITGLGYNRLHEIVDQKSLYDGLEEPVIGIPVAPVVTGYSYFKQYGRDMHTLTYPIGKPDTSVKDWKKIKWTVYGILEMPYDGWNIKGEMTIEKLGTMLCCLAIVTPVSDKQFKTPVFELQVKEISKNVYKPTIDFNASIKDKYYLMWSVNGIPVSADPEYIFKQSKNEKISVLGLEILTDRGKRYYNEVKINNIKFRFGLASFFK